MHGKQNVFKICRGRSSPDGLWRRCGPDRIQRFLWHAFGQGTGDIDRVTNQPDIVLSNTSMADALVPTDLLTGLFFNISGPSATLSRDSVVTNGSTFLNGVAISPTGAIVGGEYADKNLLAQYGANNGVSNSGLGGRLWRGRPVSGPEPVGSA